MTDFFDELVKLTGNEYAMVAEDADDLEINQFVQTGSLTFNALISGSLFKGIPHGRVTALAGEPATGKTFFAINIVKEFLNANPDARVIYFESESAVTPSMLKSRGCDAKRILIMPVVTVQDFRTQAMQIVDNQLKKKEKDRTPLMFVLDSLGNLSTTKEVNDMIAGAETRDMTRAQLLKGAFRALTLKLGQAKIPMIVTNHVYDVQNTYVPMKKMNGGSGLDYAASTIIFLGKKKSKDKDDAGTPNGVYITGLVKKGRFTIENKKATIFLNYSSGLSKYAGLLDLCLAFGLAKKVGNKIEVNGHTEFQKKIDAEPEKYFTEDFLKELDTKCHEYFCYGGSIIENEDDTADYQE
mgnify:CR=1 FL=1